jgi:hypothetical protein
MHLVLLVRHSYPVYQVATWLYLDQRLERFATTWNAFAIWCPTKLARFCTKGVTFLGRRGGDATRVCPLNFAVFLPRFEAFCWRV